MEIVKPFVKWAGGKNSLIPQLTKYYPFELKNGTIERYIEPFVGGGAVLIDILQKYEVKEAYAFDINKDLINCYNVIKTNVENLIQELDKKEKNVFYTTPDVSVYTAARKKRVVYEDSAGLCLKADKNLAETIRLSIYLLLALRKTDRYFERARESYRKNWKKLITEEFWNNYLEIDKNE